MDLQWLEPLQKIINLLQLLLKLNNIPKLIDELNFNKGGTSFEFRQEMSEAAFLETLIMIL